ncbi:MAG: hypothetical protein ACR2QV_01010 [Gammaproteobacteria bacterium]
MSFQDLGALGELIGAVAVVASLVYLAIQIRQNTRALEMSLKSTELAAFERNVDSGNRIREMFILNPEVAELYADGLKHFAKLEPSEKLRFGMILSNMFSAFQGAYVRQLTYKNDPQAFAGSIGVLDKLLALRSVRDWLDEAEPDWRPEFAALVNERLRAVRESHAHE